MDGNGRWAQERSRPRIWGHRKGMESVRAAVETAAELGLEVLTLYAFSDENWLRPVDEVSAIMEFISLYVRRELVGLKKNDVRLRIIGDVDRLPEQTRASIRHAEAELRENQGLLLNIALSYGARSELGRACRLIAEKVQRQELDPADVDSALVADHLWTSGLPDPDLLIRTSGEQRLSNFLLWQLAYTELWFTDTYWPDFRREQFVAALEHYQGRERRYGKTSAQTREESHSV